LVRRNEWVPYFERSRPISVTHPSTILAYCRVERCDNLRIRLGNRNEDGSRSASIIQDAMHSLVLVVSSKRTGRPVFCCTIAALELISLPLATSESLSFSRSHARSLLSIAKLNRARSRDRPATVRSRRSHRLFQRKHHRRAGTSRRSRSSLSLMVGS